MFLRFKPTSQFKPFKPKLKPIGTKDIMAYKQLREDGIFTGEEKVGLYGVMVSCVGFGIDLRRAKSSFSSHLMTEQAQTEPF